MTVRRPPRSPIAASRTATKTDKVAGAAQAAWTQRRPSSISARCQSTQRGLTGTLSVGAGGGSRLQ